MTNGYVYKDSLGNPSKAMDKCYLVSPGFPADMVRYVLFNSGLSATDRARCAKTCRKLRELVDSKNQYFFWQFKARYMVFCGRCYKSSSALQARMKAYLDDPKTDFSKFKLPAKFSIIKHLSSQIFRKSQHQVEGNKLNTILEECQREIEITVSETKPYLLNKEHLSATLENKDNEYELNGYHDAIYPLAEIIIDRCPKKQREFPIQFSPTEYSLPAFLCMAEAIFRKSTVPHQTMGLIIEQIKCPDDLKALNHILPLAHHLEMLTFSLAHHGWLRDGKPISEFSWTGGRGIGAFKDGLIRTPKLRILEFSDLRTHLIDEKNAQVIVDVIFARLKMKKVKPFEEIHFGPQSITPEVMCKFMELMKDYPEPIIIFMHSTVDVTQTPIPIDIIKRYQRNLNFRWDGWIVSDPLKREFACMLNEVNNPCRVSLNTCESLEAKRNKG